MIRTAKTALSLAAACLVVAAAATCTVSTTGAPCDSRDNCPKAQFCGVDGVCHSNQKNAPCETDAHCPEGDYCAGGTCAAVDTPDDAGTDAGGQDDGGVGPDAGQDAGADAGGDAGKIDCAIDSNCQTRHVAAGQCVEGRCQLTCEKGWENGNGDAADGCEAEVCNPSGWTTLTMNCTQTWDCACGNHCVKGIAGGPGSAGLGQCLEDCDYRAPKCKDSTAKCLPITTSGSTVTQANCFRTGKLTGDFKILLTDKCGAQGGGELRQGSLSLTIGGKAYAFDMFTACKKVEGDGKTYVEIQGFHILQAQPLTPGPDLIFFMIPAGKIDQSLIEMYQGSPESNFTVVQEEVTFNGYPNVSAVTLHGMGFSGKIFNLAKGAKLPAGQEYTGSVDVEMMKYDADMCGGATGTPCAF